MKIKYKGPLNDNTGLGQASRDILLLLESCDFIDLSIEVINISPNPILFSIDKIQNNIYQNNIRDYDINLIFCTPYQFHKFVEKDKINIGYTMWETDKAHADFIDSINLLDMLFVPCTSNEKVFKKINKNTFILPLPLSLNNLSCKDIGQDKNNNFTFYSIYDWTERKGGLKSLEAYFNEFANQVDVKFIIKTKGPFIGEINSQINELKEKIAKQKEIKVFPNVEFIIKDSNEAEIKKIHQQAHCYVSLSYGEGWGLPIADAGVYGNIIVASYPLGITEYLKDAKLFYPIKTKKTKVTGMEWFKYMDETHKWSEPNLNDAQEQLRNAYNYWKENDSKTLKNDRMEMKTFFLEKFNPQIISSQFIEKLNKNEK